MTTARVIAKRELTGIESTPDGGVKLLFKSGDSIELPGELGVSQTSPFVGEDQVIEPDPVDGGQTTEGATTDAPEAGAESGGDEAGAEASADAGTSEAAASS